MPTATKTITLGNEYDEVLRDTLTTVLKELGGKTSSRDWGVGGSQELETIEVDIQGRRIVVESETYMGLSIRGDADLIDHVDALVKSRLGTK